MKHGILLLVTLELLAFGGVNVSAQTSQELFDALTAKLQADVDAAKNPPPTPHVDGAPAGNPADGDHRRNFMPPPNFGRPNPQYLLSRLSGVRFFLKADQEDAAVQQLESLKPDLTNEAERDACEAVVQKLQGERAEKEASITAMATDVLKRAGEAVMKAKNPKDLDATLQELSREADDPAISRAFASHNEPFTNRLKSAARFVGRLQDCLVFVSHHDNHQAADTLRAMLSDNGDAIQAMGVPRSEIINRITAVSEPRDPDTPPARRSAAEIDADVAAAFDRVHALDDLPTAIRTLMALHDEMLAGSGRGYSTGNRANELSNTLSRLHNLAKAYTELQHGLGDPQESWFTRGEGLSDLPDESVLAVLRAQLAALALPRLLGAPDNEKPAAGERVDTFLNRLIEAAKQRGDWHAVARGVECRRALKSGGKYEVNASNNVPEESAFREFFAGQNFEQAAQYGQAVESYLTALNNGGQDLPVSLIGARLAAIRKEHPKEYAVGNRGNGSSSTVYFGDGTRSRAEQTDPSDPPSSPSNVTVSPAATPAPSASPSPSAAPPPPPATAAPTTAPNATP